jgi:hypothetical protein
MDELARHYRPSHDKKIIAKVFALGRLLAKMKVVNPRTASDDPRG